jgi:mycofactocin system glycosyltransferase
VTTAARPSPDGTLPDGFCVRLHDDVEVGPVLVAGSRVMKVSAPARRMIVDRAVTVRSPSTAALADRLLDLDLADPVVEGVVPRTDDLTVVIPVRDNPAGVDRLLGRLGDRVPCLVVDDASIDAHAIAKVVADHGVHLVRLDHNVGPAAARNVGLREVATSLVAFVDSDVDVSADALGDLTRHFVDPRLGAVAPRVTTSPGPRWFQRYEASCGSLDLGRRSATVRPWSLVTYVPSACLVARGDALGAGFDPLLRSGEDVDLVWCLQADGHRIRYAAEVTALHDARGTVRAWLGRKAFYGTSAASLAGRHNGRVAPAVLTPSVVATALGLLAQRRWSFAVAAMSAGGFARESALDLEGLGPRGRARVVTAVGVAMTRQVSGLLLRHWWPASAALALVSSRARRALVVAAVVDGVVAHRSAGTDLDLVRFGLARRADDLAYGAGVWWGAARARSVACLLPRWVSPRRRRERR